MKTGILLSLAGISVSLAQYDLIIEIPTIKTAEYHNPYVASWVENSERKHIANVALWYDLDDGGDYGTKWLKDIRKWWRKSGRNLKLPAEALSSPTKPPGEHKISLKKMIADLPANKDKTYKLYVEAAREIGGRELLAIEFKWDGKQITFITGGEKSGTTELGKVTIRKHVVKATKEKSNNE